MCLAAGMPKASWPLGFRGAAGLWGFLLGRRGCWAGEVRAVCLSAGWQPALPWELAQQMVSHGWVVEAAKRGLPPAALPGPARSRVGTSQVGARGPESVRM